MVLLSGFLEVLFKAFILFGLTLSVGGLVFAIFILRPLEKTANIDREADRRVFLTCAVGALLLAVSQCFALVIEPWSLADELGRWPIAAFLKTTFAKSGIIRAALGLCFAWFALRLAKRPESRALWSAGAIAAILLLAVGAWQTHAVSRLHNSAQLMALTVLHQLGAAIWVGGVINLAILWRFFRHLPDDNDSWPTLLGRFSPLAITATGLLASTGLYLAFNYIDDWDGLVGTAYGAIVVTKVALLASAICLGGMNFLNIRRWKRSEDRRGVMLKVPAFVEAEAGIGSIILLAAAALTSQPPALDVVAGRATPSEVLEVFAPKMPQLVPPPYREMLRHAASSFDLFSISGSLDRLQSNFNHNMAGLFVILAGIFALLYNSGKARWARHWPLLFLPLGIFLFLLAEPNGWPFGYEGFWDTLISPQVLQHRMATLLVFALALFEWRVQTAGSERIRGRFAFPVLCLAGGALLLTHCHSPFVSVWAYLIEVSHNAIGVLAVLMAAGRWLELRLPEDSRRFPAFLWPVCMILIGYVLIFYRETS
jgi:putative copper resistance protein D